MNTLSKNSHLVLWAAALLLCQWGCRPYVPVSTAASSAPQAKAEENSEIPFADAPVSGVQDGGAASPTSAASLPGPASSPVPAAAPLSPQPRRNPFRPATVEVRHVTARQATTTDIRLLGFAQKESHRFALLMKDHSMHKVQAGDSLGNWDVREIGEEIVRLRRGREEIVLELD